MATKNQKRVQSRNQVQANGNNQRVLKMHQGPLPDPETLRDYDDLIPGSAAEIIKMASDQASHRRNLETLSQKSDSDARDKQIEIERVRISGSIFTERLGVILGWLIGVFCVGAAIWAAATDKGPIITGMFLSFPIGAMINAIRKKQ